MNTTTIAPATEPKFRAIVSRAEWLAARLDLLAREKEMTRLRDDLGRRQRAMPWERLEHDYVFDGPVGRESLADLFAGRSQLVIYHFMFGPDWDEGCKSCSFFADHFNNLIVHLNARDVSMAVVSRAPIEKLLSFQRRMGWTFHWVSSFHNSFNRDFHVSFTPEEMSRGRMYYNYDTTTFPADEAPGLSVFAKGPGGEILHTYSTFARGLDHLIAAYGFLDLVPMGRNEDALEYPMAWIRHHDRYGKA